MPFNDLKFFRDRTVPLDELKRVIEGPEGPCKFVEAFEKEDIETQSSSLSSTFSANVRWNKKGGSDLTTDTKVFVKMIYADPANLTIPKTFLNELYIMNTVVRDIIRYERSPHFVVPITQVYGNKKVSDILTLETHLKNNVEHVCKPENGKIGIYNIMEHQNLDGTYFTFRELVNISDMNHDRYMVVLKTALFQVFYNLTLMENLHFRHGDLNLENVICMFIPNGIDAYYSPVPKKFIKITSKVFTSFVNFEYSSIDGFGYKTAELSDEELALSPCSEANKMNALPYGLKEGCRGWNPYADWTRFMVEFIHHLNKAKGDKLAMKIISELFPSKSLYQNIMSVLQNVDKYRFGRQSLQDLMNTVSQKILSMTTPGNLLLEYVSQFKKETLWLEKIQSSQDEDTYEYYVFKAY